MLRVWLTLWLCVASAFAGIFDLGDLDDTYAAFPNIGALWWRNGYGGACSVGGRGGSTTTYGVCKSPLECKRSGGEGGRRGSCRLQQCCVYEGLCGSVTSNKVSYFRSSDNLNSEGECTFTIRAHSPTTCQLRLDFDEFDIAEASEDSAQKENAWSCRDDSLKIRTPNDYVVPILCGYNTGQHMYIPLNASDNQLSVTLSMNLAKTLSTSVSRKWRIRITQLECPNVVAYKSKSNNQQNIYRDFWQLAPPGCLQYFTERTGIVRNFGYRPGTPVESNHYIGGLNYGICFRRTPSTCGMKFFPGKFELAADDTTSGCTDFLFIPESTLKTTTATEPPAFYKYCGKKIESTMPVSEVLSVVPTPLYMHFFTDLKKEMAEDLEHGFELNWEVPPSNNCQ